MESANLDTPIHRTNIAELPEELALKHLEPIRVNRLKWYALYKIGEEEKLTKKWDTASQSQIKQLEMLEKDIIAIDNKVASIEKRVKKIQGIRLTLGTLSMSLNNL